MATCLEKQADEEIEDRNHVQAPKGERCAFCDKPLSGIVFTSSDPKVDNYYCDRRCWSLYCED